MGFENKRVAIVGGGLGGMSFLNAAIYVGLNNVQLYEQATQFSEVGAGVNITSNANRILDTFGLQESMMRKSSRKLPSYMEYHNYKSGDYIGHIGEFSQPHARLLHRAHLLDSLKEQVPESSLNLGKHLASIDRNIAAGAAPYTLHFQDGSTAEADIVIGCDGIKSNVRREMGLGDDPNYSGQVVYRGFVDYKHLPAETAQLLRKTVNFRGPKRHVLILPIGNQETGTDRAAVIGFMSESLEAWDSESWMSRSDIDSLQEHVRDWCPEVQHIIAGLRKSSEDGKMLKQALYVRDPIEKWYEMKSELKDAGIILLGDSAHSTLPHQGQGTCMAIESGVALATVLRHWKTDDLEAAFKFYQNLRKPRTDRVTKTSYEAGKLASSDSPDQMSNNLNPDTLMERMKWIMEYNVLEDLKVKGRGCLDFQDSRLNLRISRILTSSSPSQLEFSAGKPIMEFNTTSGGFQSRRSYPSLRHISLAPLNPRFPIDDDTDLTDYLNHRDDETAASGTRTPPALSYLSSVSVPSTPPILSHSRSNSRSRYTRSKSSTKIGPLSDTNLHSRELGHALHHIPNTHKNQSSISLLQGRRPLPNNTPKSKSDAEWILRAGIALASSTREEKGQSWLSKRETSTSLVPDTPIDETSTNRHHHRNKSGASSRISRSGASTPGGGALSRTGSRRGSRRGSRVHLTMTALPASSSTSMPAERSHIRSGTSTGTVTRTASPEARGRSPLVPDFVDASIRAEMESLQHRFPDEDSVYWGRAGSGEEETSSEYSCDSDEMPDDFDEADLQQLTRERGFGLGSWIDRLVEWTLFGVDEWPAGVPAATAASRIGTADTTTTVTFEEPLLVDGRADTLSLGSVGDADLSDGDSSTGSSASIEKPGSQGGWEDAGWLFRLMKRALV
ncbi:Monooxygenase, FAD-binding [Penicillium italicum]|uniref:Monooxygenase, FAD-binding n=1 Tax=Penicillium italicum TaxID=40296 RepID=A0A0A2KNP1_PENIT|nr:Monooxygenase, FAD-binding [Penicillium italicum]